MRASVEARSLPSESGRPGRSRRASRPTTYKRQAGTVQALSFSSVILSAGSRVGHYEIVAPLGAGGMGEVYRARDPRIAREVAVKILPPVFAENADRLRRF